MGKFGHKDRVELWRRLFDEHRKSGLTVKAFCRAGKLSEPSFYWWRRKLRELETDPGLGGNILPVKIVDNQPPVETQEAGPLDTKPGGGLTGGVQIVTPGGFYLRIDSATSIEELASLLHAIELSQSKISSHGHRAQCGQSLSTRGGQGSLVQQDVGRQLGEFNRRGEAC